MSVDTFTSLQLFAIYCAMAAFGLFRTMQSEHDILWSVPQWIEKKIGVDSIVYRLISCPVCLSGQIAFWAGFFCFRSSQHPVTFVVTGALITLFWARVLEKWFNR